MDLRAIQETIRSGAGYRKFMKFTGVGIVATLLDWLIFFALVRYTSLLYPLALATSYLASTILNFFMNRRYTFRNTYKKVHLQLASFVGVAVLGLGLSEALVYGIANYLLGHSSTGLMASRVIATLVVFAWNFLLNDRITFRIFR
jgi:putative flippase GtrA